MNSTGHDAMYHFFIYEENRMRNAVNILFLVCSSIVGCSKSAPPGETIPSPLPSETTYDSTIYGKTLVYSSGEKFDLDLDVWSDGGYQWDYLLTDTNVVKIDSVRYRPQSSNWEEVGGLTIETFYLRSMRPGRCGVTIYEHRPWEHKIPPVDSMKFVVSVR